MKDALMDQNNAAKGALMFLVIGVLLVLMFYP